MSSKSTTSHVKASASAPSPAKASSALPAPAPKPPKTPITREERLKYLNDNDPTLKTA